MVASSAKDHAFHFTLDMIRAGLLGFTPPANAFDPEGAWENTYGVYTLTRECNWAGRITLKRAVKEDSSRLEIDYLKNLLGGAQHHVRAEVHCQSDALATPLSWRAHIESVNAKGEAIPETRLVKTGRRKGEKFTVTRGGKKKQLDLAPPAAINWALFDAVQRLPRETFEPLRFTMLDHFDQVKPNQVLTYQGPQTVTVGGTMAEVEHVEELDRGTIRKTRRERQGAVEITVYGFAQVGEGIVPWVYWVNEQGRLLFAVSGLEAYILETKDGSADSKSQDS